MRADVGIGPYEVVCNKALNYNLKLRTAALDGIQSRRMEKKNPHPFGWGLLSEDEGFEPPQTESESGVLPLHKSSRHSIYIIRNFPEKSRVKSEIFA